jgi:serine/threonine protein kinase/tetratricopeptide (TPR) repeat protein
MTPNRDDDARVRWQRVEALVDALLDMPPAARAAFVEQASADDLALRREALSIVLAAEDADPLDHDAIAEVAASLITHGGQAGATDPVGLPDRIGPYRVVRVLGHGGMGTVYLAARDDGEFDQTVALKLVRRGLHHDPRAVRRFRDERQTLAALQHPEIARLLDGGVTDDGLPWFAMEYIDGVPIDRYCDERRLSIEQRLELFVRVCEATSHAHAQGVVHRDIKPNNILVLPDGTPKLLDFGIAKFAQAEAGLEAAQAATMMTRTGERLLTPEYASPEQVRGEAITSAADVYALGVLLFELLTGERPFRRRGRSPHELERATLEEEPSRPSAVVTRALTSDGATDPSRTERMSATRGSTPARLKQRLRGDLDCIVLQALRKEPERRYPDATLLAADIRRHLKGLPVMARGDSLSYRARVWTRRHRRTAVAGIVGMLIGVTTLASVAFRDWRGERWMDARGLIDDVSTDSRDARRYYEDGLRAFAAGQLADAVLMFRTALGVDSTFAMAAFYGATAAQLNEDYRTARDLLEHSFRHAVGGSDRERLTVLANYYAQTRSARLHDYADSLRVRFPSTALGSLWSANAAFLAGDWSRAIEHARDVIAYDSLSIRENRVPCHACEALTLIANALIQADDLTAAEEAANVAIHKMPRSAAAWRSLAYVQLIQGAQTDTAFRRAVELDPADVDYAVEWLADAHLRRGDFAAADAMLDTRRQTAPPARVERSLGLLIRSMLMQERWDEAMSLANEFRALQQPDSGIVMARHVAIVMLQTGRAHEAAALFDSVSRWTPGQNDVRLAASHRLWHLTHKASALAAAGDTTELAALADTIRALAPLSANGRDALLPHHIDGLRQVARGDDNAAIDAFRRAIYSWNRGYTRTNAELARALLRTGRPGEAVAALQPAFRGSLEVNNSYITHTALHRLLAQAWRAAGKPDSAAVHEAWVERATRRR